ncbi:AcrR family transcriptional regulator [Nocardia transvalensis]|uniref:AcrR family transcriptional regulator n=1 Tax=Nocardia transvalensis TaxID=37333 RepID=A0A7W9PKL6_9NOCA|nr:TetR/AcrR family transcriptional regulator [Nocardia transvalensis]MBB5917243.1 AcrR family transcriptional regulator [Nocardia transvalensis]
MRADAERNRGAILAVAGRLICDDKFGNVSMDDIAAAAGVGKGTLFRRFTDREGLFRAVFDDRTSRAWAEVRDLAGDTTKPAEERILAFVATVFDLTAIELQPLMRALPDGCQTETWAPWRALLAQLISQIDPGADAEFLALAIFAGMRPEITDMITPQRHRDGVLALTERLLGLG